MAGALEMDIQAKRRQAVTSARGRRSQCVEEMGEFVVRLVLEKSLTDSGSDDPLGAGPKRFTNHQTEFSTPLETNAGAASHGAGACPRDHTNTSIGSFHSACSIPTTSDALWLRSSATTGQCSIQLAVKAAVMGHDFAAIYAFHNAARAVMDRKPMHDVVGLQGAAVHPVAYGAYGSRR